MLAAALHLLTSDLCLVCLSAQRHVINNVNRLVQTANPAAALYTSRLSTLLAAAAAAALSFAYSPLSHTHSLFSHFLHLALVVVYVLQVQVQCGGYLI